jgi:hypothetical protein
LLNRLLKRKSLSLKRRNLSLKRKVLLWKRRNRRLRWKLLPRLLPRALLQ